MVLFTSCSVDRSNILQTQPSIGIVIIVNGQYANEVISNGFKVSIDPVISYISQADFSEETILFPTEAVDTFLINTNHSGLVLTHNSIRTHKRNLFLFSGDTLLIDYHNLEPTFKLTGNSQKFEQIFYELDSISETLGLKSLPLFDSQGFFLSNKEKKEYLDKMKQFSTMKTAQLRSALKNNSISKNQFILEKVTDSIEIVRYAFLNKLTNKLNVDEESGVSLSDSFNDSLLQIPAYRNHIWTHTYLNSNLPVIKINSGLEYDFRTLFKRLESVENESKTLEYLKFKTLEKIAEIFPITEINSLMDKYDFDTLNTGYYKRFSKKYGHLLVDNERDDYLQVLDSNRFLHNYSELVSDRPNNKILYFWASWCAPCFKTIPSILDYTSNKNDPFEVVFISIDRNYDDWISASSKLGIKGNSFLARSYPKSKFFQDTQLSSVPRTVIVDEQGKVIDSNFDLTKILTNSEY